MAFSLILPHLTPPGAMSRSGESVRVVTDSFAFVNVTDLAADADRLFVQPSESAEALGGESFGDTYSGDYSHETDKLLMLFSLHWGRVAVSWGSIYSAVLSPDPVFSFERPPKSAVA